MVRALPHVLDRLAADPAVRVVVVRGAGGRAFAAGVDITDFADGAGRSVVAAFEADYAAMLDRVRRHDRVYDRDDRRCLRGRWRRTGPRL